MARLLLETVLCILYIMLHMNLTFCYKYGDMKILMNDLLNETRYSKLIRPLHSQDQQMQVNITPGLMSIEQLDVTSGELVAVAFVMITWRDEYLVWNPEDYGGISTLYLPFDQLWVPPLSQFGGGMQGNTGQIINPGFAPILIVSTGSVMLVTVRFFSTKCDIDVSLYPFDKHLCSFTFVSGLHNVSDIEINSPTDGFTFQFFVDNNGWSIEGSMYDRIVYTDNVTSYSISGLEFSLVLRRRPSFDLINTYIPIFLLASLNIATSLVPPNSGERLSFTVTLYLSFIFITSALIDEMPHVAVKIAISSYIMLVLNALNTASVLWSVFIVRMTNWDNRSRRIPKLVVKMVRCYHKICIKQFQRVRVNPIENTEIEVIHDHEETSNETKNNVNQDVRSNASGEQNPLNLENVSWLHVAFVLDKVYLTITVFMYVSAFVVMILYWVLSK